jgi:acetoin utilization protein AcuB
MNVAPHMQRDAVTALPTATLDAVRRVMDERGFGLLLVASEVGELRGFVTRATLKGVTDWSAAVETVCHRARFAVSPDDSLEKAALIMLENRLVLLPVVDGDRLVGTISQSEVLRGLANGLGIGLGGTRMRIKIRDDSDDLYRALEVLRQHQIRLLSLVTKRHEEGRSEAVLHVDGIEDRDALRAQIEARLRDEG